MHTGATPVNGGAYRFITFSAEENEEPTFRALLEKAIGES